MTNIIKQGQEIGERLNKIGYDFGKTFAMQNMIIPQFHISNTQHQKIMEILGIKNYNTKKVFSNYLIITNGYKNNGGEKNGVHK